jgi:hypothetical protein
MGVSTAQIYLSVHTDSPTSVILNEQQNNETPIGHPFDGGVPDLSAWHTYDVTVSFMDGSYSLTIDGVASHGNVSLSWSPGPARLLVSAGVYSPGKDTGQEHVHIDNVVLYTSPP